MIKEMVKLSLKRKVLFWIICCCLVAKLCPILLRPHGL